MMWLENALETKKTRRVIALLLLSVGTGLAIYNASELPLLWETVPGRIGALVVALLLLVALREGGGKKLIEKHRRGAIEKTYEAAVKRARALCKKFGAGPFFGMLELPFQSKDGHFAVIGATGSGKTVTIRLFLQRIIPELEKGKLQGRALIYDPKQDMVPILKALKPTVPIHILNPFDARSSAWDMAQDITEPATAYQLASLIISDPDKADGNSMFFISTMRNIMSAVLQSFIEFTPTVWTFRDVLLAMSTEFNLRLVLGRTPKGRQVLEACLKRGETFDNIRASIEARISEYEIIAALWHNSTRPGFSLRQWLQGRSIAVLGNRESSRKVMDTLNSLIFNRLAELINDGPEINHETTWIVLDEVRRAGKLDKLKDLLLFGRSKGASLLLGFQDVDGLREVYGQNVANEILGQCANKAILWLNSPETAKWASSLFGETELTEAHNNHNANSQGAFALAAGSVGVTRSESVAKRDMVMTSQLLTKTGLFGLGGIGGYYTLQNVGDYKVRVSTDWVKKELVPKDEATECLVPRPTEHQRLQPWDAEDIIRLSLPLEELARQIEAEEAAQGGRSVTAPGVDLPRRTINPPEA